MTLTLDNDPDGTLATEIGSMLFTRFVSGTRVVAPGKDSSVSGRKFTNFGAHSDVYPSAYLTAAAAVGMTTKDVDSFITRLEKVLAKLKHQNTGEAAAAGGDKDETGKVVELDGGIDSATDEQVSLALHQKFAQKQPSSARRDEGDGHE
jgi:O-phospho-L-seryl-tRNASec:L-selenocysteinyl-tRNA synthase